MLRLHAPEPTTQALIAIAASGSTGLSRKAQQEMQRRKTAELAADVERGKAEGGSAS